MKISCLLILLIFSSAIFSQSKEMKGEITNAFEVENIHILNTTSRHNTITDEYGKFTINVSVHDTLYISSVKYAPQKMIISEADFESGTLIITLAEFVNELDEVYLGPRLSGNLSQDLKNIKTEEIFNFDDVGIPGFKGKPEEKIVPIVPGIGTITTVDIEALYKHISGYYKKLRLERKWDSQNVDAEKIINFYTIAFFKEAYHIPENRLYEFMLFCLETSSLKKDFENKNFISVLTLFEEKSKIYRARLNQASEKK